jgi:CHAT domain-containing protein/predicted negative regulator of RcsB-dependent stress response
MLKYILFFSLLLVICYWGYQQNYKLRKLKRFFQIKNNKQQTTKTSFVLLFIASFLCIQGLALVLGTKSLPVVAQTPVGVTNTQETANPDTLVEEAKRLYRAEQFSEALSRLQQAANAFAAKGDVLKQAMTLDLQGQVYLAQGQPETAVEQFSAAATIYERKGDKTGALKSRLNQAQALRQAGFNRRALDILRQVNNNLTDQTEPQLKAIALRSLAITERLIGDLDKAQTAIEESLKIAESLASPAREENISTGYLVLGNIAKDRANTLKDRGNITEARTQFEQAIAHYKKAAETATTPTAKVEAQLNELSVLGDQEKPFTDAERELLRQVRKTLDQLPLSRTAVHARINWARMVTEQKNEAKVNPQDIAQQLTLALEQARTLKDQRSESYALGQLGLLRKELGQLDQAQANTKQALTIAQSIGATDIAYRWQWQLGQIMIAQGKTDGAIASYEAAINNLRSIRGELATLNRDAQFSFRESVEPVYREFAGLLLQSKNVQNLEKARVAIESFQQAELIDFFRENCITSKPIKIDDIDTKAAVIYPIVLADRLEVILSLPGNRFEQHTISKPRVEVQGIFTRLREAITPSIIDPRSAQPRLIPRAKQDGEYLQLAQQVYDWLIRPFDEEIKANGVETLVFVLDRLLLNLPMAVLHDGEKFLVEKYAIALTPGLQLLDSKPLVRGEITALKAGLSEDRELPLGNPPQNVHFPALPNVEQELKGIQSQVSGKLILNKEFTTDEIGRAINSVSFPIVHLATHGKFSSNAEETFVLTSDGRLNIKQLKQVLRGREEDRRNAIELLVLSACETAAGDEGAALGLAGVAVQAGARSTLATLWVVNDEATAKLMIQFYEELKDTKVSKAEALRRAQLWLMQQDSKYKQPDYWAAFVLVGNWL